MIDIEKVREAIENIKKIDIYVDGSFWNYKDTDYKNDVIVIEQALTELERLQKREVRFKKMLNDTIESNEVKLKKGYWDRIVYENQILKNVLNMLDWSDEK